MPLTYLKRLIWPTIVVLVVLLPGWPWIAEYGAEAKDATQKVLFYFFGVSIGVALAWWIVRLIEVFIWGVIEARSKSQIPRLLKDIVAALVFLLVGITIVELVFQQSVAGLWATTGVVGLVVGLALRAMIADVFGGIAINIDQPFRIGHWIQVLPRGIEPLEGRVREISWRCTRIWTKENNLIVVPNHLISTSALINCSEPETKSRFRATFTLALSVPIEQALRVLLAGAKAANGPLDNPAPSVKIYRVTELGVEYRVQYWLEPAEVSPQQGRYAITRSILDHLHHAGISVAHPQQDVYIAKMSARKNESSVERSVILRRVEIFSALEAEEINLLATQMREHPIATGQAIVTKGEVGDSMYILVEGLLDVLSSAIPDQPLYRVDSIRPGEFFGEMSMLTGEPRSATVIAITDAVVLEISKADFSRLLDNRPEIAQQISKVIAERREGLIAQGKVTPEHPVLSKESFADQMVKRMKVFFSHLRHSMGAKPAEPAPAPPEIDSPSPAAPPPLQGTQ